MQEEQPYVVPFSLVGFFITRKSIDESIRSDLTHEEFEHFQEIVRRFLFTEGVKVAIYPSIVPPDQVMDAIEELEEDFFEDDYD
ncbi:MAG: hypothetical protein ABDH18_04380 [Aquificaceae bacterium]